VGHPAAPAHLTVANVRTKQLWAPAVAGTVASTLYTTPSGETTILKTVTLVNGGALARPVILGINGTAAGDRIVWESVPTQAGLLLVNLFVVLQPGDTIDALASSGNVTVGGFGTELEGVAD